MQVIWDLCHYGWPDDLDIFTPAFVQRFAGMAEAFTKILTSETDTLPFLTPINEISFFSWAAGEVGSFYPFAQGQGHHLKMQLVRAAIESIEAIWNIEPKARIVHIDPLIHVVADPATPHEQEVAERYRLLQYDAWDMICGRSFPELGGDEKYLDIIGVNYYSDNQWLYTRDAFHPDLVLDRFHPQYRPLHHMLWEIYQRYGRPLFIAETGAEGEVRPAWLRYVGQEVRAAIKAGVPVKGLCLYPIMNFPGWEDERHCHNGLWDYADTDGQRQIYEPLACELLRQRRDIGDHSNMSHHESGTEFQLADSSRIRKM